MTPLLDAVMAATLASSGVAAPEPLAERFDVLGLQVCLGAVDDAKPCDVRLFAPQVSRTSSTPGTETTEPEPLEISLLGRTVCLGHATGDASCDVTLFPRRREEVQG